MESPNVAKNIKKSHGFAADPFLLDNIHKYVEFSPFYGPQLSAQILRRRKGKQSLCSVLLLVMEYSVYACGHAGTSQTKVESELETQVPVDPDM